MRPRAGCCSGYRKLRNIVPLVTGITHGTKQEVLFVVRHERRLAFLLDRQSTPSAHESGPQLRARRRGLLRGNHRRNITTPRRTGRPNWRTLGVRLEALLTALGAMLRS